MYIWVTRSRTISFRTLGVRFFLLSSIVGALIAAMIDGRHISGILNPFNCGLGVEKEIDDATDKVSESCQVGLNGGLPGGENGGSIDAERL